MATLVACFKPIYGWQSQPGKPLHFGAEPGYREKHDNRGNIKRTSTGTWRKVDVPCGYCLGCRLSKSRAWAIRCMHEAHMHQQNCFVTLTYDEANYAPGLNYADFKKFIRRLVQAKGKTRYFMCGEYGDKLKRPHFHALLFGQDFPDRKNMGRIDTSEQLTQLWGLGYASVGHATHQSAGYIARYTVKKQYGPRQAEHYQRVHLGTGELVQVTPELAQMSRRPGIGMTFLEKYWPEIYLARDAVILQGGRKNKPPRAYDTWLKQNDHELKDWKDYERYINSKEFIKDTTPERLRVRELIANENIKRALRTLE